MKYAGNATVIASEEVGERSPRTRLKPVRFPLLRLLALDGSFTPSMANMARPTRPSRLRSQRTWAKSRSAPAPNPETKAARVAKWGAVSPHRATKVR